jgi:hypothetical protein
MPELPLLHRNKHLLLTNFFQIALGESRAEKNKPRVRFSALHSIKNEPSLAFKNFANSTILHVNS